MADPNRPPVTFDFGDTPEPTPDEGVLHKIWRIYNQPITQTLGLNDQLDKAAQPGLNDSVGGARIKGFLTGAAEAVKPSHLVDLAGAFAGLPIAEKAPALFSGALGLSSAAGATRGGIDLANDIKDPTKSKWDVAKDIGEIGLGAAGAAGGAMGVRNASRFSKAVQQTSKAGELSKAQIIGNQVDAIKNAVTSNDPELGKFATLQDYIAAKHPEAWTEMSKNPGGKTATSIFGEDGLPKPPTPADLYQQNIKNAKDLSKSQDQANKLVQGEAASDTDIAAKAIEDREKIKKATNAEFKQAMNAADTRFKAGQNEAASDIQVQEALQKAQDERIAAANAEAQQGRIDKFINREDVSAGPESVTESAQGQGPNGERRVLRQSFNENPPDEEGGEGGDVGPTKPLEKRVLNKSQVMEFLNRPDIDPEEWSVTGKYGMYKISKRPADVNLPGTDLNGSEAARPFAQLTRAEQKGLVPLLQEAAKGGVPEDQLDSLADQLADHLNFLKAGREGVEGTSADIDQVLSHIRKGGAIFDDGSDEIRGVRDALKQSGRSIQGIFSKKAGRSIDQASQDLKDLYPNIPRDNEFSLANFISKAVKGGVSEGSALDELVSKFSGKKWWEPKPTLGADVTDFTGGDVPTVDVPPPTPKDKGRVSKLTKGQKFDQAAQAIADQAPPLETPSASGPGVLDKAVEDLRLKQGEPDTLEGAGEDRFGQPYPSDTSVSSSIPADASDADAAAQVLADPKSSPRLKTWATNVIRQLSGEGGTGKLGGEGGFARAAVPIHMASGALGGLIGAQQDPFGNRPLSAAAGVGLGLAAPELGPRLIKSVVGGGPGLLDKLNRLHNTGLLSPLSVAKKAAGDIGGLSLAAIENPARAGDMMRQFLSPEGRALMTQNFREGFSGPEEAQNALSGMENYISNVKNPLSWSGRMMGGLTKATKGVLGESGFTPQEQRYYTLTAKPSEMSDVGKSIYTILNRNKILQHISPFARIGVNRLERAAEYSPLGFLNPKVLEGGELNPAKLVKPILGTGAMYGAYNMTPDNFVKEHPVAASTAASLAGPMGIPVLASMAMANARGDEGLDYLKSAAEASGTVGRDIPGLRMIEDVTGRSFPTGFARNYFSGYTNFARPIANAIDMARGEEDNADIAPRRPTTRQKLLGAEEPPVWQQLFARALDNVPYIRHLLPEKEASLTTRPKVTFKF